ncbi:uncharacterized protein [Maniola hyperantus]|uniref:uncharacterized protein n=1 Tax=Aphantopus hyperantus TaxID=2795564 RepID=UPI00213804F6
MYKFTIVALALVAVAAASPGYYSGGGDIGSQSGFAQGRQRGSSGQGGQGSQGGFENDQDEFGGQGGSRGRQQGGFGSQDEDGQHQGGFVNQGEEGKQHGRSHGQHSDRENSDGEFDSERK